MWLKQVRHDFQSYDEFKNHYLCDEVVQFQLEDVWYVVVDTRVAQGEYWIDAIRRDKY